MGVWEEDRSQESDVRIASARRLRGARDFEAYTRGAGPDHVDSASGGTRQIKDASFRERTTIGDAHVDAFSILKIRDFDLGLKWKRAMRGGQSLHVENFAGGGASPVIRIAVPTRDSGFGVTGAHGRGGDGTRNGSARGFVSARGDDARSDNDRGESVTRATRMKWGSEHLKQFYTATFYRL